MNTSPCLVLVALLGFAAAAPADEPHSMTGCLAAGAAEGSFMLNDVEGGAGPVAIPQSSVDLAPHVGHKVEITGTSIDGTDPETHTMKVTAMKHLAATCP
ncbi:MAG TPA: hypothetical protein PJ986_17575 [Gammaproteobacteria bacterium]|nr:hypothetical protein [Gammaproteobacteria bacterium]